MRDADDGQAGACSATGTRTRGARGPSHSCWSVKLTHSPASRPQRVCICRCVCRSGEGLTAEKLALHGKTPEPRTGLFGTSEQALCQPWVARGCSLLCPVRVDSEPQLWVIRARSSLAYGNEMQETLGGCSPGRGTGGSAEAPTPPLPVAPALWAAACPSLWGLFLHGPRASFLEDVR